MIEYELKLMSLGSKLIAGVDEVGRGCLAGPMVVAAVILKPELIQLLDQHKTTDVPFRESRNNDVSCLKIDQSALIQQLTQIKDSKVLTAKKRRELSDFIKEHAFSYSIVEISAQQIDALGISQCTQLGFSSSINQLDTKPDHILTDAFPIKSIPIETQTNIISGDAKSITIAAASIIAKVYRDNLMSKLDSKYAPYNFEKHKGYGTKLHLDTISKIGPCDIHRMTFAPLNKRAGN